MTKKIVAIALVISTAALAFHTAHAAEQSIKYLNVDYVLANAPGIETVKSELESYHATMQDEFDSRRDELAVAMRKFQEIATLLSEADREERVLKLQQQQRDLEEFSRTLQPELDKKRVALLEPFYQRIQVATEAVAKRNNYDYVLKPRAGDSTTILFAKPEHDISELVLEELAKAN
ncbi:OmpH family outer membrane protein [Pelagicoccus sp. SDUM812003]|uniref:OmpH family outer membrane protein n=1 Tax=Pelagicoccus sp. SDUM812003 TaxID=3041267 RepID=UPI002811EDC0|nr:OmpH family outer membrane protein [Pelagicoccus sp. SDUM812003]